MLGFKTNRKLDFDTLFKEYNAYVFKIVINESNNKLTKEDIEEVVSDSFFLLWKNYGKITNEKKVKSYLAQIAKNTTKNKLRRLKESLSFDDQMLGNQISKSDSHDVKDQLKIINQSLKDMDKIDKKIFLMYYYENKKIKEIAKLENMNTSTVKTRLHRTRKKLKKLLEKRGFRK